MNGGCPFDGTSRDADFSNNGAIAAEDYASLVDGWLTMSGCACSLVFAPERPDHPTSVLANTPALQALDLNGDGCIDADDVELFEIRHALSGELSARMRASR